MLKSLRVLVAAPDSPSRKTLGKVLSGKGLSTVFASTLGEARSVLGHEPVAMVFCEAKLKDGGFRELLCEDESVRPKVPVVVCADFYDKDLYMDAMCLGAFDFIAYPYHHQEVDWILTGALRRATAVAVSA